MATYCAPCRALRRRVLNQRGRAPLLCACGSARPYARKFCPPCTARRHDEAVARYYAGPKSRARYSRYTQKPATKIRRSLYVDAHRVEVRRNSAQYAAKLRKAGTIKVCITELCGKTFAMAYRGGARRFCDECQTLFYGPAYRRRLARRRAVARAA